MKNKNENLVIPEGRKLAKKPNSLISSLITKENINEDIKDHENILNPQRSTENDKTSEKIEITTEKKIIIDKKKHKEKKGIITANVPDRFLKGDLGDIRLPRYLIKYIKKKGIDNDININTFFIEAAYNELIKRGWLKETDKDQE